MGKIVVTRAVVSSPTEYFLSKNYDTVYRRGKEGLCITPDGGIRAMDYSGIAERVFENEE